ncbi:MAG TPA: hypothetical protein VGI54_00650 [Solirubrobacteraceae bacterium]|jgi:hypothetical protein
MALLGSKRRNSKEQASSRPAQPGAAPPQKLPPPPAKAKTSSGSGSGKPPGTSQAPARPGERPGTMIPARSRRSAFESVFMRLIATAGIVGVGVAVAAIMESSDAQGWIIGLVVSLLCVVMAAVLWSSRRL